MMQGYVKENLFVNSTDSCVFQELPMLDTVSKLMSFAAEKYAERTAIVDGESYSFSELEKKAGAVRALLSEKGIAKGDSVGVLYPNSFDFVAAALGVMSYGAVAVLLPFSLDAKTVFGCTVKYRIGLVLADPAAGERLELAIGMNKNLSVVFTPDIKEGYEPAAEVDGGSGAAVVFTAGTTGQSKGALLSHLALTVGMRNGCYGYGDPRFQRYFLILPLTHIFGLVRNLLTSVYTGSSLYICRNLKEMFRELPVFKPTLIVAVPALAELALNMTKMLSVAILGGELKTIICGAAVVSPYLAREYGKIGVNLLAGYGMTETANLVSGNPKTLENPESVGFMYPGQDFRIVDGELRLKGDNILTEYYMDPEETAKAFDEDGYFKTGDLVRLDENGFLYITGRSKEIIVLSNGENISPAELETRFCELDCIQDALIYKVTDGTSESLTLEILPRATELKKAGVENVAEYCIAKAKEVNNTLYAHQRVSNIIVRTEDFARTPSMKIIRPKSL